MQSVDEYNQDAPKRVSEVESGRYERGSLKQKLFEPLAGAKRDQNGTLVYTVQDKELSYALNSEHLRRQFERAQSQEALEFGEEEADELRVALLDEMRGNDLPVDDWNEMLDRELSVFKNGEKYDYVTDLRRTYD